MMAVASTAVAGELVLQNGLDGYEGTRDATIAGHPETLRELNYGATPTLRVGGVAHGGLRRLALVRFEQLQERLPTGATVKAAYLELYKVGEPQNGGQYEKVKEKDRVIGMYALLKPWTAGTGNGDRQIGGVTFSHRGSNEDGLVEYWGDANQIEEGPVSAVDYSGSEAARAKLRPDEPDIWFRWEVSDLVRQWVANPEANHGVILMARSFYVGCDFASSEEERQEMRPRLIIEY